MAVKISLFHNQDLLLSKIPLYYSHLNFKPCFSSQNNLQMQMFIPPQVRFPQGGNGRFQIFTKPRAGWILRVISAVSFSLVPRGPLHDSAFVPVITFAHLSWITVAHRKDFLFYISLLKEDVSGQGSVIKLFIHCLGWVRVRQRLLLRHVFSVVS